MTMRTNYTVYCECGHKGTIILSENDTPYSNQFWTNLKLVDLNGLSGSISEAHDWDIIFSCQRISCPKCNQQLSDKNLSSC